MAGKLPKGWIETTLGKVCVFNPRPDLEDLKPEQTEVSFVPMSAVEEETGRIDASRTRPLFQVQRGYTCFKENDIIFSKITPCMENGKIALAEGLKNGLGYGSTEFIVIRPYFGVLPRFLLHFLLQLSFRREAQRHMSGAVGQQRVSLEYLFNHSFLLPPSEEQERIVQKLDVSLSALGRGENIARRAFNRLHQYRTSVTYNAGTGELTKAWRKTQSAPGLGQDLFQKIMRTRRARWEDVQNGQQTNNAKPNRSKAQYRVPVNPETTDLPKLPKTWTWASLDMIAEISSGISVSRNRIVEDPVEVPYLRVANVLRGTLDLTEIKKIRISRNQLDSYLLEPGDILFNEGGDIDKLGRGWIWEGQIPKCVHQNHVFRARLLDPSLIRPELVSHWGNTFGQQFFIKHGTQSTNLASISRSVLASFPVPIPPASEQKAIIEELYKRLAAAAKLEATLKGQIAISSDTKQSLLNAAFTGKLVSQKDHAEPASILIERIREFQIARALKPKAKRQPKMDTKNTLRPLIEVLREQKHPISPEQLFIAAGFKPNQVDLFYRQLLSIKSAIKEHKPSSTDKNDWPKSKQVFLELK